MVFVLVNQAHNCAAYDDTVGKARDFPRLLRLGYAKAHSYRQFRYFADFVHFGFYVVNFRRGSAVMPVMEI